MANWKNTKLKGLKSAALLASVVVISGCIPTVELIVTTTSSNPACDGSGVTSGTGPLSVGGTGGCITSVSSELESQAAAIRASSQYRNLEITHDVNGTTYRSNALIAGRFEYAHALNLTGAEQIIAVHDNGFLASHVEFQDKSITFANGKDADTITVQSHGTATAALAAGTAAFGETVGAAPNATLYLSSWNDGDDYVPFEDARAIEAIVVNNSWGYECPGDPFGECGINDYSTSLITNRTRNALINYAGSTGIVVFSASNEENQTQSTFMAALPMLIPSLEEGWLAVINVARQYDPSEADLFDDSAVGLLSSGCLEAARWCVAADGTTLIASSSGTGNYSVGTGTSYAAPRVSAAIAILAEAFPNLTPSEIRNRLIVTADNAFFAADTAQIQTLNFASGLSHEYHVVYGHGFIDLRAALLPIGTTTTTTAKGDVLNLASPVILASGASGDAVATALAKVTLSASDQMGGDFELQGDSMVANLTSVDRSTRALTALSAPNGVLPDTFETDFDAAEGVVVPLEFAGGTTAELRLPQSGKNKAGLRLSQTFETTSGLLSVGVSALDEPTSLLGLSLGDSGTINSDHIGFEAQFSTQVNPDLTLTLSGQSGVATSQSSGVFDGISPVTYDAIGARLSQQGALLANDTLSFFANRPTAIRSGSATATFNIASNGAARFATVDIPLAPSARETEIGVTYSAQGAANTEWTFQASRRFNAENIAGKDAASVLINVKKAF